MTVVLLVLVAAVCGCVALQSMNESARTSRDLFQLQRKWGSISIQQVVLPLAEAEIEARNATTTTPVSHIHQVITLGGVQFRVTLGDEQAKLNANTMARGMIPRDLDRVLEALVQHGGSHFSLRARYIEDSVQDRESRAIRVFEQLAEFRSIADIHSREQGGGSLADLVTLWGDGRINLRRADEAVLRTACEPYLNPAEFEQLAELRRLRPNIGVAAVLAELALPGERANALSVALADDSDCYSIWIEAVGKRRSWYRFGLVDSVHKTGVVLEW